mgnify:CR=1 FL=1
MKFQAVIRLTVLASTNSNIDNNSKNKSNSASIATATTIATTMDLKKVLYL